LSIENWSLEFSILNSQFSIPQHQAGRSGCNSRVLSPS
jgi:hypothetical protein